jgi:hypothetical protein
MPRHPRLFLPDAIYHVYCRVARGEFVFDDDFEASGEIPWEEPRPLTLVRPSEPDGPSEIRGRRGTRSRPTEVRQTWRFPGFLGIQPTYRNAGTDHEVLGGQCRTLPKVRGASCEILEYDTRVAWMER